MPSILRPNSEGEPELTSLREAPSWSDSARSASAASRGGRGKGLPTRRKAAQQAFTKAGGQRSAGASARKAHSELFRGLDREMEDDPDFSEDRLSRDSARRFTKAIGAASRLRTKLGPTGRQKLKTIIRQRRAGDLSPGWHHQILDIIKSSRTKK